LVCPFQEKDEAGAIYYENIFKASLGCSIQGILSVVSILPQAFTEDMNQSLEEVVSWFEIKSALFSMQSGKSPGLDGFTVEFFNIYYEIIKEDLLLMVRESQRTGKVLGAINSTFLFLIPKSQDGITFEDFRPISCCNVTFKIISKVIARHLKHMLREIISEEQFGFLRNREIHDL
jgi:hypothetical protein